MAKKLPLSILSTFTVLSIYGNPTYEEIKEKKPSFFIEDNKKSSFILTEKNFTDYSFVVSSEKENYSPINNFINKENDKSIYDSLYISNEKNFINNEYMLNTLSISSNDNLYNNKFEPWNMGAETNFSLKEDFFNQINKKNNDYSSIKIIKESNDPYSEGILNSYIDYSMVEKNDFGEVLIQKGTNGVFLIGNFDLMNKDLKIRNFKLSLSNNNNEYQINLKDFSLDTNNISNDFLSTEYHKEETVFNNLNSGYDFKMYIAYEDLGFDENDNISLKIVEEE